MKKYICSILLVFAIVGIFSPTAFCASAKGGDPTFVVLENEQPKQYTITPIIEDGISLVPIKDFCSLFGLDIEWSDSRKEITVKDKETILVLKVGSTTALVNHKLKSMPNPVAIMEGKSIASLPFLAGVFHMQTSWDADSRQVSVTMPSTVKISTEPAFKMVGYDEAFKSGLRKSAAYQNMLLSSSRAKQINDEFYVSDDTYLPSVLQAKQELRLYDTWAEKQIIITAEQVSNSIKNQMDDLSLLSVEKKNQLAKIDLMAEKLRIERLSYDFGLTSLQSLMTTQSSYQSEMQNLTIIEQKINVAYTKLNQILGNPADYRNDLEYDVSYSPVGAVDLEKKIASDTYADPYIWFAGQNVGVKELKLNTYVYNAGNQSWELTALDLTQAKQNLNDAKTALAGVIRERYNNLIQLEEQIRLMEITLEQARDSVNSIRLQYDLGNVIKLQVEEAQMAIPNLEYQIQSLKQQHEQLKMLFEKPYLAPTYVNG